MANPPDCEFDFLANDTISRLEDVAEAARLALQEAHIHGSNALASVNTMTSAPAVQRLETISYQNIETYKVLTREPAIARVVVADSDGNEETYFFCRTTPLKGFRNHANIYAKVGRLAALPIGSDFQLPNGKIVEVLERAMIRPVVNNASWDSRNTIVESDSFSPVTIESLRALLAAGLAPEFNEAYLRQLIKEQPEATKIQDGIRRSIITKMHLRDQPVLDQYQDDIFRLPLAIHLLILGPPGTGKTTTLIRRLRQKIDISLLEADEQDTVERLQLSGGSAHESSWLMFTPTDLLKQYLKEAFAREGVPASDLRIKTWVDYRRDLARNVFGLLRTAAGGGTFVLKDSDEYLTEDTLADPVAWYLDFNQWQTSAFVEELQASGRVLTAGISSDISSLWKELVPTIEGATTRGLEVLFSSLASKVPDIQALIAAHKEETDKRIYGAILAQLRKDGRFLDDLAKFIDTIEGADAEDDESDDQDVDDDEVNGPKTGRAAAVSAYMKAVRAKARAKITKRSIGKTSRNGRVLDWIGERTLNDRELSEVGSSLLIQTNSRRVLNSGKRYIDGIPKRYRMFRRIRQEQNKWYKESINSTELHPLELDILLLAILSNCNDLLVKPGILRDVEKPFWSSVKVVKDLHRNQILVDEATDFSAIQIGCMAALAQPSLQSFVACGDFNQRLTIWGTRCIDHIKTVLPKLEVEEISVSYRQTRQLNDLAKSIILACGGTPGGITLPEHVDSEGVPPALLEGVSDFTLTIAWVADRIRDIERLVGFLPSVAIFVENEVHVQPVADALSATLTADNTQVVACHNGQAIGQDHDVRVFNIEHIKGLEFEAVFFVGVDHLAALHPQLFDKFLYVGTTRAATYLGITCFHKLPDDIVPLRHMFVSSWGTPNEMASVR